MRNARGHARNRFARRPARMNELMSGLPFCLDNIGSAAEHAQPVGSAAMTRSTCSNRTAGRR